MDPNLLNLQLL